MPIPVISKFKPINDGYFPVVEDVDIQGGYQVRNNLADLNSIPLANRKNGMLVYVVSESKYYTLSSGVWVEANLGGGSVTVSKINSSPNTHIGQFFSGPLTNQNMPTLPSGKILSIGNGGIVNKIVFDPTFYDYSTVSPEFPIKKGPYFWFNRTDCFDVLKADYSSNSTYCLPLEDSRKYDSSRFPVSFSDLSINYNDKKGYSLDIDNKFVVKFDTTEVQNEKVITFNGLSLFPPLPIDAEDEVIALNPFRILYDSVNNKTIVCPNLQTFTNIYLWSLDSEDNVTEHAASIPGTSGDPLNFYYGTSYNISGGYLWISLKPIEGAPTTLTFKTIKFDLNTMQVVELIEPTRDSFFQDIVKIIKHPTLNIIYLLSDDYNLYRFNLDDLTTQAIPLLSGTVSFTINSSGDIFAPGNGGIRHITDDGSSIVSTDYSFSFGPYVSEYVPNSPQILAIEYAADVDIVLLSDQANSAIYQLGAPGDYGSVIYYTGLIGYTYWKNANVRKVKNIDGPSISYSYTVGPNDDIILVNNSYIPSTTTWNTVNINLGNGFEIGTTITIKDVSGLGTFDPSPPPLISIYCDEGFDFQNSPVPFYLNLRKYYTAVTLVRQGVGWRILSSYVEVPEITLDTSGT